MGNCKLLKTNNGIIWSQRAEKYKHESKIEHIQVENPVIYKVSPSLVWLELILAR